MDRGSLRRAVTIVAGTSIVLCLWAGYSLLHRRNGPALDKGSQVTALPLFARENEEQRQLAIKHRIALLTQIGHDLEEHGIAVRIDGDLGVLRLAASQFFDPGKAIPNPGQQDHLASLLSVLAARLPCYAGDNSPSVPTCPPTENQRLASVRLDVFHERKRPDPRCRYFSQCQPVVARRGATYDIVERHSVYETVTAYWACWSPSDEQLLPKSTAYGPQWVDAPSSDSTSHIDLQLTMVRLPAELIAYLQYASVGTVNALMPADPSKAIANDGIGILGYSVKPKLANAMLRVHVTANVYAPQQENDVTLAVFRGGQQQPLMFQSKHVAAKMWAFFDISSDLSAGGADGVDFTVRAGVVHPGTVLINGTEAGVPATVPLPYIAIEEQD